jgi:hypothetical protein
MECMEIFPKEIIDRKKLLSLLGDGWLHLPKDRIFSREGRTRNGIVRNFLLIH